MGRVVVFSNGRRWFDSIQSRMAKAKKVRSNKYVYWYKEKYLFYLLIPYWSYCDECGHRELRWNQKGFVLLKRTRCRRLRTIMDDMGDYYAKFFLRNIQNMSNMNRARKGKVPQTLKFRRYGDLKSV